MKKSLIFALTALLAVSFTFFGCPSNPSDNPDSGTETPDTPAKTQPTKTDVTSIKIEKNGTYNNQAVITFLDEANEYVAKKGDVLTFTIKGTPDGDVSGLKAFIIDNSSAAANYWNLLSGYINTDINLTKGEETTITVKATITADASSKEPAACKLALYFEPVQDDAVTIAVSSFDVKVE